MADVLKHAFVSGKADGGDTTLVRPSNWNAAHAFAGGATGALLVRRSTEADGADWSTNFVGPYAIGGATNSAVQLLLLGTFVGTAGFDVNSRIQPAANQSAFGSTIAPTIDEAVSGTHPDFASLRVIPPTITAGVAALTNATTLLVTAAPTGATNNYALWVAAGTVRVDGAIRFQVGLTATTPATIYLDPGASGWLTVNSGGSGFLWFDSGRLAERMRLTDGGILALGTTVITGASAGDLILKNAGQLKGVNAAGTTTRQLIEYDASDRVKLAGGGDVVVVGSVISTGATAGDLVLGNTKVLRFVNVAGTSAVGVLTLDVGDNLRIRPTPTGPVSIGDPATIAGSAAGDLILANANRLLFVNFAGIATLRLIGGNTNNNVLLGDASTATGVGSPASFTGAAAGDLVLANAKDLRWANAAGTSALPALRVDASNRLRINPDGNFVVGIGNPTFIGAAANDFVLPNTNALRFANVAGTSTANFGITGDANDDLVLMVPGATDRIRFTWVGADDFQMLRENGGVGLLFATESSADHAAPSANRAVLYTKDDGGGNTRIVARFATGDPVVVADQSGNLISKQNLLFDSGTAFVGTLNHDITAARTWTLPNYAGGLDVTDPHDRFVFMEDFDAIRDDPGVSDVEWFATRSLWHTESNGANIVRLSSVGGVLSVGNGGTGRVTLADVEGAVGDAHLPFLASKNPHLKMRFTRQGAGAANPFFVGFHGVANPPDAAPADGIYCRYLEGGNVIAVARAASTETTIDTGVTIAAGTFVEVTMEVRGGNSVQVFVDGVDKGNIGSNVPTVALGLWISNGGNAVGHPIEVDYLYVSQER